MTLPPTFDGLLGAPAFVRAILSTVRLIDLVSAHIVAQFWMAQTHVRARGMGARTRWREPQT